MLYSLPVDVKEAGLSSVAVELLFESAVTVRNEAEREKGVAERREGRDKRYGWCGLNCMTFSLPPFLPAAALVQALQGHIHRHFHIKLEVYSIRMQHQQPYTA